MKVVVDTSVVVELERKNKLVLELIKGLVERNSDLSISIVTLSEILAGCHLREDYEKASNEAKRVLSQFLWVDMDSDVAEKTAEYLAFLIKKGKIIEFPDVVIAATFNVLGGNYLLTLNKHHFEHITELKGKVFTPKELNAKFYEGKEGDSERG
ncbi:type II toxin-antitoxin system VapC family toxin [Candidatus Woesearchaeota archaeon]|nr:type II toxin-antitoxin system VapC family toxin [Candidatus Woesearchaeota archaeon]